MFRQDSFARLPEIPSLRFGVPVIRRVIVGRPRGRCAGTSLEYVYSLPAGGGATLQGNPDKLIVRALPANSGPFDPDIVHDMAPDIPVSAALRRDIGRG